jgi:hypothetical protein
MRRTWSDSEARTGELDALCERLELRIHAIAMLVTAIVLAMRLVAGTQDITSEPASAEYESTDAAAPDAAALWVL